jgi:hypothetical protein
MIIDEEQQKRPCFKFFTHGYCNFGSQCRSSHKTSEELQYLKDMYTIGELFYIKYIYIQHDLKKIFLKNAIIK